MNADDRVDFGIGVEDSLHFADVSAVAPLDLVVHVEDRGVIPGAGAFDLSIRSVYKAGSGFPNPLIPLTVHVGPSTNVKWVARGPGGPSWSRPP